MFRRRKTLRSSRSLSFERSNFALARSVSFNTTYDDGEKSARVSKLPGRKLHIDNVVLERSHNVIQFSWTGVVQIMK